MTFLKVLLAVLAVLWLISLIRVGGRVSYGQAGLFVYLLMGPVKLQLFPTANASGGNGRPKAKKPKKEKPPMAERHKKEPREGQPGTLSRLMKLLPVVGQACGSLKRKIRIDELELEVIWGGTDAAAVALGYGRANAVLGMLWPVFDHNFKVKRHSFQISADYGRTEPAAELRAAVTMTVGQMMTLGVHYGVKALFTWIKSGRPAAKRQEA
ncbi:MAG: DUF2953 domain-containing protein [Oscillospiraceae bacterium]|nr:DUF2953 domain-containing protein [Oscillospiraceae bacterium]